MDEDENQINIGKIVDVEEEKEIDPNNPKDIRNFSRSPFQMRDSKVHPISKHDRADM